VSGRSPISKLAKDLGISDSCLRNWIARAEIDEGRREGTTSAERAELVELRRKLRVALAEGVMISRAVGMLLSSRPPILVARQGDGTVRQWHGTISGVFSDGVGMMAVEVVRGQGRGEGVKDIVGGGGEAGLLPAPVGVAFDDEFVGGGPEPSIADWARRGSAMNAPGTSCRRRRVP
jgi:hypothetical protein